MKELKVVMGKNFGDEGKGSTVHKLCKGKNALVVRHNGGAQAGHTVEEGAFRFVFHELGSGTYAGCPTYWSSTFLPDLLKLGEEVEDYLEERARAEKTDNCGADDDSTTTAQMPVEGNCWSNDARGKDACPTIYAHPDCACTIIYDVLLNSILETIRGSSKHGSCGMGIYEAVLRNRAIVQGACDKKCTYTLRLQDFVDARVEDVVEQLRYIRDDYTISRLRTLEQEYAEAFQRADVSEWVELIQDENVLWNVAEEMYHNFHTYVQLKEWRDVRDEYDTVIFENAQGLMLDQDNEEYYPHLTPSYTGMDNIVALLKEDENRRNYQIEMIYVTRTYVTRHGMGRLDYECSKEDINADMVDKTNVPNQWQDSLRYGKHPDVNTHVFWKYMLNETGKLNSIGCIEKAAVAIRVTHLDETDGKMIFVDENMDIDVFKQHCDKQGVDLYF